MSKYSNLVTVLKSNNNQFKSWYLNENNEYEILDKTFSKFYEFSEIAINDIHDLHKLVLEYSYRGDTCFIRGKITEHGYEEQRKGYRIRRIASNSRVKENNELIKETIKDYPKKWLMLDIDNFPTPEGTILNFSHHRERAVESFIKTLHESFHNSSYVCQFSNGMFMNSKKIKAHLWFMLSENYKCETLKPWFEKYCSGVDKCVFRPGQILYTSNPRFVNSVDPLKRQRIYLKEKKNNTVNLPKKSVLNEYLSLDN